MSAIFAGKGRLSEQCGNHNMLMYNMLAYCLPIDAVKQEQVKHRNQNLNKKNFSTHILPYYGSLGLSWWLQSVEHLVTRPSHGCAIKQGDLSVRPPGKGEIDQQLTTTHLLGVSPMLCAAC